MMLLIPDLQAVRGIAFHNERIMWTNPANLSAIIVKPKTRKSHVR